jgi:hypothetical protein
MWTTGESVLYVFLYYAVLMAIGCVDAIKTGIGNIKSNTESVFRLYRRHDDGLCGECEEPPKMTVSAADGMMHETPILLVPAVMIEPVEPIVYAQTGPWWGEPDRQD